MLLFAILPFIFGYLVFVLFCYNYDHQGVYTRIRIAALQAVLLTCLYGVIITETLNRFSSINFYWLLAAWSVPALIMTAFSIRRKILMPITGEVFSALWKLLFKSPLLILISFFLLAILVVALIYPPNNYDSMTYHMARVAHWQQNENIAHYQTHILRQLIYPPFAEWVILHFQVLTGGDRFANSIQFFFFVGCIWNSSLLTKELGGSFRQQLLAAIFCCFIPMAILQSNTTQNDIVVGYFVTGFIYLIIRLVKAPTNHLLILSGICLGLAWLTKGTSFIFTLPVNIWVLCILIRNRHESFRQVILKCLWLMLIPATALVINSPHFYRNGFLTNSALGKASEGTANEGFAIKPLLLVGIKNFMNHTPVDKPMKEKLVRLASAWDIDVNDPAYNFNTIDWMMEGISYHEDYAQNFPHVILIVLMSIILLFQKDLFTQRIGYYTLFLISIYAMALLYCILLKWQPWSNRLQTPLFILFSVMLGMQVGRMTGFLRFLLSAPIVIFGFVVFLNNAQHPILPIKSSILYQPYESFIYRKGMMECRDYIDSTNYEKLGIWLGPDSWDYQYYKLLSKSGSKKRILKHIFVANESSIYLDQFVPDAIISLDSGREKYIIGTTEYYRSRLFSDGIALFEIKK
jgi:4-amino-4-deoxy-L-arabinose transferase-like glycosyltransferase